MSLWVIKTTYSWGGESHLVKRFDSIEEATKVLDAVARAHVNTFVICQPPHNRMTCSKASRGGLSWNRGPREPSIPEYHFRLDGHPYMSITLVEENNV